MGVFEIPQFARGTNKIANAVAENAGAITIVGGGDSLAAVTAAGVADKGRIVANDDHRLVPQFLELAHLAHGDRVAQMDIDASGVDAVFDPQWDAGLAALLEPGDKVLLGQDFFRPAANDGQLLVNWQKLNHA